MYEEAISILKQIEELGFEAYIIGGYPRDKYRQIENEDIDICTNISENILLNNFNVTKKNGFGSFIINNNFEITLFRKDYYENTRYPKIEYINELEKDLERRDFLINTLCINSKGEFIDILGARKDIDSRVIKTVKDADVSFKEDPIRIIRALRFKMDLGFKLSSEVENSIKCNKHLLQKISQNRIEKEIRKIKKLNIEELNEYIGDKYARKNS